MHIYIYTDIRIKLALEDNTDENVPTPAQDLLKLAKEEKIHELYSGEVDSKVFAYFIVNVVAHVVMKCKWNMHSHVRLMNSFVTLSDEAFAVLVLENNCDRWLDEAQHPNKTRHRRTKPKYTKDGGADAGWSIDGMFRFRNICEQIDFEKKRYPENYNMILQRIRSLEQECNSRSRRKRRKTCHGGELNHTHEEEEKRLDLEDFLMGNVQLRQPSAEEQNEELGIDEAVGISTSRVGEGED